jgi:hypothetical protein
VLEYRGPQERKRISIFAVFGLALGLLGAVPTLLWAMVAMATDPDWGIVIVVVTLARVAPFLFIAAVAGLLAAIVGIRATRQTNVRGRKRATVGLVLSIAATLIWGSMFGMQIFARATRYHQTHGPEVAAIQFLNDLAKSPQSAATDCTPDIAMSDLSYVAGQLQQWGGLGALTVRDVMPDQNSHITQQTCAVDVQIGAPRGTHFIAVRVKQIAGVWKVYWYRWR